MGMIVDVFDSPLGKMHLCSNGSHITAITFEGQKYEAHHIPQDSTNGSCPVLEQAKVWLSQYFHGEIPPNLPPLMPKGTPFQQLVWQKLLQIPYGKTVTYGQLAQLTGCRSAQAIGNAVGRNPISILIPCHRVVGKGGKLTGFVGGVEKKEYLLQLEQSTRIEICTP